MTTNFPPKKKQSRKGLLLQNLLLIGEIAQITFAISSRNNWHLLHSDILTHGEFLFKKSTSESSTSQTMKIK